MTGAQIEEVVTKREKLCNRDYSAHFGKTACEWSDDDLRRVVAIPIRGSADQPAQIDPSGAGIPDPGKWSNDNQPISKAWEQVKAMVPAANSEPVELVKIWRDIGCAANGAPFVADGLIKNAKELIETLTAGAPQGSGQLLRGFEAALLNPDCPGAAGISVANKSALHELVSR